MGRIETGTEMVVILPVLEKMIHESVPTKGVATRKILASCADINGFVLWWVFRVSSLSSLHQQG